MSLFPSQDRPVPCWGMRRPQASTRAARQYEGSHVRSVAMSELLCGNKKDDAPFRLQASLM